MKVARIHEHGGVDVLRYKMIAVLISSGMAAIGGAWAAFYYKNLFPETAFRIAPHGTASHTLRRDGGEHDVRP
jgi:ABC-type uncharacterized transport system permease subunit